MFQTIQFASQGAKLAGNLYLPKQIDKTEKSLPVVVLCHGFCGVKELLLPAYAQAFANAGYAALTFDYRGFGESEGETGRLVPALQIEDIKAAVSWLSEHKAIDSDRIALWGSSFGGANAIITAADLPKIKTVICQLAFANGERVITGSMSAEDKAKFIGTLEKMRDKKAKTGKEMMVPISKVLSDEQSQQFYRDYKDEFPALGIKIPFLTIWETIQHKPETVVANVKVPLLIVAAENDSVNPLAESQALYDLANEPKVLYIEKSASHYQLYTGECFDRVINEQLNWLKKYL